MSRQKHTLDEMQESKLTKIEGIGFWLAFAALLAAIIIQVLIHPDLTQIAGELTVFFTLSLYLVIFCLKNGLWSKSPAPTITGNLAASVLAALILSAVMVLRALISRKGFSAGFVVVLLLLMALTFAGCFASLEVMRAIYKRRRGKLDSIEGESEAS